MSSNLIISLIIVTLICRQSDAANNTQLIQLGNRNISADQVLEPVEKETVIEITEEIAREISIY